MVDPVRNRGSVSASRPVTLGCKQFVPREGIAELAAVGVRIDRHMFRSDIDEFADQIL